MEETLSLETLLQKYGEQQGVELQLDALGKCHLESETGTFLTIHAAQSDDLYITTSLVGIPDDLAEANQLLLRALNLNLFVERTNGAAIAYDPGTNSLLLSDRRALEDFDADSLGGFMTIFAHTAESLIRVFQNLDDQPEGEEEEAPA